MNDKEFAIAEGRISRAKEIKRVSRLLDNMIDKLKEPSGRIEIVVRDENAHDPKYLTEIFQGVEIFNSFGDTLLDYLKLQKEKLREEYSNL